jgi:mono/diheme cytochrome c family protein
MKHVLFVLLLAACGGPSAKPVTTPEAPAPKWKDMNADQRMAFMKSTVLPRAKKLFGDFDPQKYAVVNCHTCHGKGSEDGSFEMPNPDIKALPASEEAYVAWISKDPEAARYTKFMSEQIVPAVAEMLDVKAFDPKTHTGEFSCPACHTMAKAP